MDPNLKGYSFKDAFEFFKYFIKVLHEDLKFFGSKDFDMKKQIKIEESVTEEWEQINKTQSFTDFSVISSTFKGKLCAKVTCVKCESLFWYEEDFMGLSLEIPQFSKKLTNKLKEWGIQKMKENQKMSKKERGFFDKLIFGNQEEFQEEELLNLYHCLINFCETEQTSEIDSFSCEKCEGLVQVKKTFSFLTLPNILTFQLQRFNEQSGKKITQEVKIPEFLDLSYFTRKVEIFDQDLNKYSLFGIIEHKKCLGGDQYISYIKNPQTNLYYCFEDNQLKIVDFKYIEQYVVPYIVFYQLINTSDINESLRRNIKSQVNLLKSKSINMRDDDLSYIPSFWYQRFLYSAKPQAIITSHLLCEHKKIKPDYFDCFPPRTMRKNQAFLNENSVLDNSVSIDFSVNENNLDTQYAKEFLINQSTIIPKVINTYLRESYGGGPIISLDMDICTSCIKLARAIRLRRKMEKDIINKFDNQITEESYLIEEEWMNSWKEYLYSNKKYFKRNFIKGLPPPKSIQNSKLLGANKQLLGGLKKNVHFRIVNEFIWKIFKILYGGSPALVINERQNQKKKLPLSKVFLSEQDIEVLEEMKNLLNPDYVLQNEQQEKHKNFLPKEFTNNIQNSSSRNSSQKKLQQYN